MQRNIFILFSLVLTLILFTACGSNNQNDEKEQAAEIEQEIPEAELDDVPNIVAEINEEEIKKDEFTVVYEQILQNEAMQAQMLGEEVDQKELKSEVIDLLVDRELLIQEAKEQIKEIPQKEMDKAINDDIENNELKNKDELFELFKEHDIDKDEYLEELELQLKIDQLIERKMGDFKITKEDKKAEYKLIKEQYEEMDEEIPSFDEIEKQLEKEMIDREKGKVADQLIEELKLDANVKVHL